MSRAAERLGCSHRRRCWNYSNRQHRCWSYLNSTPSQPQEARPETGAARPPKAQEHSAREWWQPELPAGPIHRETETARQWTLARPEPRKASTQLEHSSDCCFDRMRALPSSKARRRASRQAHFAPSTQPRALPQPDKGELFRDTSFPVYYPTEGLDAGSGHFVIDCR